MKRQSFAILIIKSLIEKGTTEADEIAVDAADAAAIASLKEKLKQAKANIKARKEQESIKNRKFKASEQSKMIDGYYAESARDAIRIIHQNNAQKDNVAAEEAKRLESERRKAVAKEPAVEWRKTRLRMSGIEFDDATLTNAQADSLYRRHKKDRDGAAASPKLLESLRKIGIKPKAGQIISMKDAQLAIALDRAKKYPPSEKQVAFMKQKGMDYAEWDRLTATRKIKQYVNLTNVARYRSPDKENLTAAEAYMVYAAQMLREVKSVIQRYGDVQIMGKMFKAGYREEHILKAVQDHSPRAGGQNMEFLEHMAIIAKKDPEVEKSLKKQEKCIVPMSERQARFFRENGMDADNADLTKISRSEAAWKIARKEAQDRIEAFVRPRRKNLSLREQYLIRAKEEYVRAGGRLEFYSDRRVALDLVRDGMSKEEIKYQINGNSPKLANSTPDFIDAYVNAALMQYEREHMSNDIKEPASLSSDEKIISKEEMEKRKLRVAKEQNGKGKCNDLRFAALMSLTSRQKRLKFMTKEIIK